MEIHVNPTLATVSAIVLIATFVGCAGAVRTITVTGQSGRASVDPTGEYM